VALSALCVAAFFQLRLDTGGFFRARRFRSSVHSNRFLFHSYAFLGDRVGFAGVLDAALAVMTTVT
jgi:hypothetical protein